MTMAVQLNDATIAAIAETVVDVLADRGLVTQAPAAQRVLNARQVADQLGLGQQWVYEHAAELGAFRLGSGRRARLGFDQHRITAYKEARALDPDQPAPTPDRPRRQAPAPSAPLIPYEEQ